jgi:hypothetical protein
VPKVAFSDDAEVVGEREGTRNDPVTIPLVIGHWKKSKVLVSNKLYCEGEDEAKKSSGSVMVMYFVAVTVCLDFVVLVVGAM